jgi:hypothetical protein
VNGMTAHGRNPDPPIDNRSVLARSPEVLPQITESAKLH